MPPASREWRGILLALIRNEGARHFQSVALQREPFVIAGQPCQSLLVRCRQRDACSLNPPTESSLGGVQILADLPDAAVSDAAATHDFSRELGGE